jgi:ABC-type uncharacterized transport system substrate-binding protein
VNLLLRRVGLALFLIASAAAVLLASDLGSRRGAGKPAKERLWNVDLLAYIDVVDVEDAERGIRAGLHEAGLREGEDFRFTVRNAQGDMATLSALVDAAVTDRADLVMTLSTPTLQAALQRASRLPIVFTFVADAVAAGAGTSNEEHLPNVTGVPTVSAYPELVAITLECLPDTRRIGTLFVPAEANSAVNRERLTQEAAKRGIEVVALPVNTIGELPDAADALASHPIDAIVQIGTNLTTAGFASIARSARRERVPLFGALTSDADNGAAVVVARDYYDGGLRAGHLAARVLRGESPRGIPFEPLRTSKLLVNPSAARAMGFALPESVVARASRVIVIETD